MYSKELCELIRALGTRIKSTTVYESSFLHLKIDEMSAEDVEELGWTCPKCTFKNNPTRPGCETCDEPKPDNLSERKRGSQRDVSKVTDALESKSLAAFVEMIFASLADGAPRRL